jgi:hypothetical protein
MMTPTAPFDQMSRRNRVAESGHFRQVYSGRRAPQPARLARCADAISRIASVSRIAHEPREHVETRDPSIAALALDRAQSPRDVERIVFNHAELRGLRLCPRPGTTVDRSAHDERDPRSQRERSGIHGARAMNAGG